MLLSAVFTTLKHSCASPPYNNLHLERQSWTRRDSGSPLSAVGNSDVHRDWYLRTQLGIKWAFGVV